MTWDDLQAKLEARLQTITRRTGAVERDLRRPLQADSEERALEAENDQVLEQLDHEGRHEMRQIQAALSRIEAGTYGSCTACGGPIGEDRLRILPFAARCITCAERA